MELKTFAVATVVSKTYFSTQELVLEIVKAYSSQEAKVIVFEKMENKGYTNNTGILVREVILDETNN